MKQYLFPIVAVFITVAFVGGVYWYTDQNKEVINHTEAVKQTTLDVIDSGIDFSNSLYPPEDQPLIREKLQEARDKITNDELFTEQHIFSTAIWYYNSNDFDRALTLYDAADLFGAGELNYRISRATINIKRENLDDAIKELQLLTTAWPTPETFLALADAYKKLPDTPNYVIDDIYADGLAKQNSHTFELLEAAIKWYEQTYRPQEEIEYYERIIKLVEDPTTYQNRLDEIKNQ